MPLFSGNTQSLENTQHYWLKNVNSALTHCCQKQSWLIVLVCVWSLPVDKCVNCRSFDMFYGKTRCFPKRHQKHRKIQRCLQLWRKSSSKSRSTVQHSFCYVANIDYTTLPCLGTSQDIAIFAGQRRLSAHARQSFNSTNKHRYKTKRDLHNYRFYIVVDITYHKYIYLQVQKKVSEKSHTTFFIEKQISIQLKHTLF